jgi:hypothetical protein
VQAGGISGPKKVDRSSAEEAALARHRRSRAIGVVVVGLLSGPAGGAASAQPAPAPLATAEAPVSCPEPIGHRQCLRRCTPANLMLLPCMAVGAKAMPACREREVGLCVAICQRRFC